MSFWQKTVLAVVGVVAVLAVGSRYQAQASVSNVSAESLWGQKFLDVAGKPVALSNYRGKVLVVNFWATWCPPCRREMPGFSRLQENLQGKNVQFVGVAIDTAENVRDFSVLHPVSYPLLIGGDGAVALTRELGNTGMGLPFTVLVDANGRVRRQKLGGYAEMDLNADLQALLTEGVR